LHIVASRSTGSDTRRADQDEPFDQGLIRRFRSHVERDAPSIRMPDDGDGSGHSMSDALGDELGMLRHTASHGWSRRVPVSGEVDVDDVVLALQGSRDDAHISRTTAPAMKQKNGFSGPGPAFLHVKPFIAESAIDSRTGGMLG